MSSEKQEKEAFDEDALQREIERVWGKYGAHAEVFSMMRRAVVEMATGEPGNWHGAEPVRAALALEPAQTASEQGQTAELSEDDWLALAERRATADWESNAPDGYLLAVKALCRDFASIAGFKACANTGSASGSTQTAAAAAPTQFWHLVELFEPDGNSLGFYHTGWTDIDGHSRTTTDPWQAHRYCSHAEAQIVAEKLLSKRGVWRVVEHGFDGNTQTAAPQPEPLTERAKFDHRRSLLLGADPSPWQAGELLRLIIESAPESQSAPTDRCTAPADAQLDGPKGSSRAPAVEQDALHVGNYVVRGGRVVEYEILNAADERPDGTYPLFSPLSRAP